MSTVTENDLRELKELINSRFNELEKGQTEIKGEIKTLDAKMQGIEKRIDDTNKRIDDLNGRLNIMTIGFLSIVGVLVTGILGIIGKVVFFSSNA